MAEEEVEINPEGGEGIDTLGEYVGERNSKNERHGKGRALLPNGDIYEGMYSRGKRHGKGLYVFRNGARYNGEWCKGLKYGEGVFYYPDGSKYEGDWKRDMKHGYGAYYYPNGDIYEGTWMKGKRHGLGAYMYAQSGTRFLGTWNQGKMEGPGQLIHPSHRFHGEWNNNLPKGRGVYIFQPDLMQHGSYLHVKDPEFTYVMPESLEDEAQEEQTLPKGVVPIWHVQNITKYDPDLMPPEAKPVQITDSVESVVEEEEEGQEEEPLLEETEEEGEKAEAWEEEENKSLLQTEEADADGTVLFYVKCQLSPITFSNCPLSFLNCMSEQGRPVLMCYSATAQ
ncbi:radial spoke head 1 homolog isoform X1 [Periplaneta americana]|uniref:radial spoke head 1 homolog isoform X1 n=1 Tax=Periplaneta americana TaxID=6978 RepID=UPI0037E96514